MLAKVTQLLTNGLSTKNGKTSAGKSPKMNSKNARIVKRLRKLLEEANSGDSNDVSSTDKQAEQAIDDNSGSENKNNPPRNLSKTFCWENHFGFEILYSSTFGLDKWHFCRLGAPLFEIRSVKALITCYHVMLSCMTYKITDYMELHFHVLSVVRRRTGYDSIANSLQMRPRYYRQNDLGLNETGFNCLNAGYKDLPVIPFNEISWHKGEQSILLSCQGRVTSANDLCTLNHGCSLFNMCKLNSFLGAHKMPFSLF